MPVMKRLVVGGTTYDTVGEASVTQTVSSGTKIASVSIDGTSTDLYAPLASSSVSNEHLTINSLGDTQSEYTLPTASTSTLGGVKVDGSTITADANGVISVASSGGGGSGTENDPLPELWIGDSTNGYACLRMSCVTSSNFSLIAVLYSPDKSYSGSRTIGSLIVSASGGSND